MATKTKKMTQKQIDKAVKHARSNLLDGFCAHRNEFTIGWCAAFVQFGRLHVVQRAHLPEVRS